MKRIGVFLSSLLLGCASSLLALPVTDGLVMDLNADNIPGSAVAGDGTIESWIDSSGMGNHATQSNSLNKPVYVASNPDFKGHASVSFDGIDDWMGLNSNMVNVGSFTAFAVAKFDIMAGERYIIAGQPGGSGAERMRICTNTSNRFLWRAGNSGDVTSAGNTDTHVFAMTSAVTAYLDGTDMGTTNNSSVLYPTALNIGSYNRGTKAFFPGDVAALVIYNRVLTTEEIELVNTYLANKYVIGATEPTPANGATGVGTVGAELTTTLQWKAACDPDNPTMVDPAVKKHYVYLTNKENDPNLYLVASLDVTDYTDLNGSYGPITLQYDRSYKWMVEEGIADGLGGVLPAGDPNNYAGKEWTFEAMPSVPVVTVQPVSAKVDIDAQALINIEFTSISTATATWYKNGEILTLDSRITASTDNDSSSLTIQNFTTADEGDYYCVLTSAGGTTTSDSATLVAKKLLASYAFEQNYNDGQGVNHGSAVDNPIFSQGTIGNYSVESTDGLGYVMLTTDAYPKAGFGNGLEQFTYAFWAFPSASLSGEGRIMASFNDGSTTGMQFGVSGNGAIKTYIRDQQNRSLEVFSGDNAIADEVWSHVSITYDGTTFRYYVNGSMIKEQTVSTLADFVDWQYPMTIMAKNSRGSIVERYRG
ncbi:MAG: immunoglobulin domain-containing protein, partial [Sedimentisphaerales bacterium]|nr:immunoglobulin domain-containing protein [Sedimentisphaerales bacterium]